MTSRRQPPHPNIRQWLGLRNAGPPESQPLGALELADNVILSDVAMLEAAPYFSLTMPLTGISDSYEHKSNNYAFLIADGALLCVFEGPAIKTLLTGLTSAAMAWAQVENRTFFAGPQGEAGIVVNGESVLPLRFPLPQTPSATALAGSMPPGTYQFSQVLRHLDSGLEGPAAPVAWVHAQTPCAFRIGLEVPAGYLADVYVSSADSQTLRYLTTAATGAVFYDLPAQRLQQPLEAEQKDSWPLPEHVIALEVHETCLYAAVFNQLGNTSTVYFSRPLFHHLFALDQDGFPLPGRVRQMVSTEQGLLIATDQGLWLHGETLQRLTDYGCPEGLPCCKDRDGRVLIWTHRGLHTFPPLTDVFAGKLSVAPGSRCAVTTMPLRGSKVGLVLTDDGGEAFGAY